MIVFRFGFISFPTLYTYIFLFLYLQFFSTCFGPTGPSSGESPDDGPAGPKHVEKNCKYKKRKI